MELKPFLLFSSLVEIIEDGSNDNDEVFDICYSVEKIGSNAEIKREDLECLKTSQLKYRMLPCCHCLTMSCEFHKGLLLLLLLLLWLYNIMFWSDSTR